jgi:site-specific DNA-cytosine methylase
VALLCEIEPHLIRLLTSSFPDAEVYSDVYHEPWLECRKQGFAVPLIAAGIACQPFFNRSLRLHKADPRAYQSLKVCDAAVALEAVYILLKNGANFVDQDHIHGVFSATVAYYLERGYSLTCVTRPQGRATS